MRRLTLFVGVLVVLTACVAQGVTIETVPVGNPGNSADTRVGYGGYGSVGYNYNIGKYEVTCAQYTEFLNAKAKTDLYGLYNPEMWSESRGYGCKIQRNGVSGSYTYSVAAEYANRPVNYVSFWDAARFTNWLHNGQNDGDTETGAYTLGASTISRNAGAKFFVPSENEWYKAAYYDPNKAGGAGYWDYPTRSNDVPNHHLTSPDPGNNANYYVLYYDYTIGSPYWRTAVGAFENSKSPYGTFDQGGNVWEWNETFLTDSNSALRGGSWADGSEGLLASHRVVEGTPELYNFGFRVAEVPEPSTFVLLGMGAAGLLGFAWRRRKHRAGA